MEPPQTARQEYISRLQDAADLFPAAPNVTVELQDVSYVLPLPVAKVDGRVETFGDKILGLALSPLSLLRSALRTLAGRTSKPREFRVLSNVSATFRPGTMTLILAPAGHGKTSLLRAIAGHIPELSGSVSYSGKTAADLRSSGISLSRLVGYVDQLDRHIPLLTVAETVHFAWSTTTVKPSVMRVTKSTSALEAAERNRVSHVLKMLGLTGSADTLLGNETVKGASGGEKRRVSIAEALVTNARVLALDEYSTGLDATTTFDVTACIRAWCHARQGTVVASLLQATPEIYNLFDDVLLLREGRIVYHGPRDAVPAYLAGIGFTQPTEASVLSSGDVSATQKDVAGWILSVLSQAASRTSLKSPRVMGNDETPASPESTPFRFSNMSPSVSSTQLSDIGNADSDPPSSTGDMVRMWESSTTYRYRQMSAKLLPSPELELVSDFAKAQYGSRSLCSSLACAPVIFWRQWLIMKRAPGYIVGRAVGSTIVLILAGAMWHFTINPVLLVGLFWVALNNLIDFKEIPHVAESKRTVYHQIATGMYPGFTFTACINLLNLPISAVFALITSVAVYFSAGLVLDASRFLTFVIIVFSTDIALGSFFRFSAYVAPSLQAANSIVGPFMAIMVLYSGFFLSPSKMGWLVFLHYVSPLAYGLRSLALNEFLSSKYDTYEGSQKRGAAILSVFEFKTDPSWLWGGVLYCLGVFVVMTIVSGVIVGRARQESDIGTVRQEDDATLNCHPAASSSKPSIQTSPITSFRSSLKAFETCSVNPLTSPGTSSKPGLRTRGFRPTRIAGQAIALAPHNTLFPRNRPILPFTPTTIVWKNICYRVAARAANASGASHDKFLLRGVTGYASPGVLTALMGASGAGKTTLLDVISDRKTVGRIDGTIFLNGVPCSHKDKVFARLTAYCEQIDVHAPYVTVLEALEFSAALRLDSSVTAKQRRELVEDILNVLEITDIKDRRVGESGEADSLSAWQRKVLTIGTELVANRPILFLDEPTSGLDADNASIVMRVIRNVANKGYTVVATIHQPSKELFFMFDNILLLQRGGWQVYFGPLGREAVNLVRYLQSLPGIQKMPVSLNPASWMLDLMEGSDSTDGGIVVGQGGNKTYPDLEVSSRLDGKALQNEYFRSATWAMLKPAFEAKSVAPRGAKVHRYLSEHARSSPFQLYKLIERTATGYWRNTTYSFSRWISLLGLLVIFGIIYSNVAKSIDNFSGLQSIVAVGFSGSLYFALFTVAFTLPNLFKERAVFYRERASNCYGPEVYALAVFIVEAPWVWFNVCCSMTIMYFMCGFVADASILFFFLFITWLASLVLVALLQIVSMSFATMSDAQSAIGGLFEFFALFAGLCIPIGGLPDSWHWGFYLDPFYYILEAAVSPLLHCSDDSTGFVSIPVEDAFNKYYGFSYEHRWRDAGILSLFICAFIGFGLVAHRFISHQLR